MNYSHSDCVRCIVMHISGNVGVCRLVPSHLNAINTKCMTWLNGHDSVYQIKLMTGMRIYNKTRAEIHVLQFA